MLEHEHQWTGESHEVEVVSHLDTRRLIPGVVANCAECGYIAITSEYAAAYTPGDTMGGFRLPTAGELAHYNEVLEGE